MFVRWVCVAESFWRYLQRILFVQFAKLTIPYLTFVNYENRAVTRIDDYVRPLAPEFNFAET